MTTIPEVETTCYVCHTFYKGFQVNSWSSWPALGYPEPKINPLTCPECHAPYRVSREPQIGRVRDLLPHLESDSHHVASTLASSVVTPAEFHAWIALFLNLNA